MEQQECSFLFFPKCAGVQMVCQLTLMEAISFFNCHTEHVEVLQLEKIKLKAGITLAKMPKLSFLKKIKLTRELNFLPLIKMIFTDFQN